MTPDVRHLIWHLAAAFVGVGSFYFFSRYFAKAYAELERPRWRPLTFLSLGLGAALGALLFSGVDFDDPTLVQWVHILDGSVIGSLISVEVYWQMSGVKRSPIVRFVIPMALAIATARWGCFKLALADGQVGRGTWQFWGLPYADSYPRHPLALFEVVVMAVFAAGMILLTDWKPKFVCRYGYFALIMTYAVTRFCAEYLKIRGVRETHFAYHNMIQWGMVGLMAYAFVSLDRRHEFDEKDALDQA